MLISNKIHYFRNFTPTKLPKRLQIDVLFTKQKHYFCNEVIKQWKHKAD